MSHNHKIDMLHGPLVPNLLAFAIPLMLSGMLQQSFIAVDVAIVGRYASSRALAAVGSNGPLVNILVNLFVGISIGANVVIANYIGRRNNNGIRKAVATTASLSVVSGFALLAIGQLLCRPILEAMGTPDDVIELATDYLAIYFLGMPFMMVYNFGSAILRSMGDTRRPLYALIYAAIANTALDYLLTGVLGMGVNGVAIATVCANVINSACIIRWLIREEDPYRLNIKELKVSVSELKKMLQIGVPAGMQGMVFSGANLFIQSAINTYGSAVMAGSSLALNFECYCYFIVAAFGQAATAFMSQNFGSGQYDRCRKVVVRCMVLSVSFMVISTGIINVFPAGFSSIFTSDPEVIKWSIVRIHTVLLFQAIACSYEITGSGMRGLGNSLTPMLLTVLGTCVLRLVWIFTVGTQTRDFALLLAIYPISWIVTGILVVIAYRRMAARCLKGRNRVAGDRASQSF